MVLLLAAFGCSARVAAVRSDTHLALHVRTSNETSSNSSVATLSPLLIRTPAPNSSRDSIPTYLLKHADFHLPRAWIVRSGNPQSRQRLRPPTPETDSTVLPPGQPCSSRQLLKNSNIHARSAGRPSLLTQAGDWLVRRTTVSARYSLNSSWDSIPMHLLSTQIPPPQRLDHAIRNAQPRQRLRFPTPGNDSAVLPPGQRCFSRPAPEMCPHPRSVMVASMVTNMVVVMAATLQPRCVDALHERAQPTLETAMTRSRPGAMQTGVASARSGPVTPRLSSYRSVCAAPVAQRPHTASTPLQLEPYLTSVFI
jgi:hypothetical protein